ncbi:hypothetical protein PIROE2DRAFT_6117 [Piromyces sp. E2]|nr:hypothetical protein PIROE2DRAFT_6117 [Piromyces sp. E2]|eukprot:OUM66594.1 hypothetical protein PIROE2DRAFT_6117 [Piromyces sp. E2]
MKYYNLFFSIILIVISHYNLNNVSGLLLTGEIPFPEFTEFAITKECFGNTNFIADNCKYNLIRNVIYCKTTVNDLVYDLKISIRNKPREDVSDLKIESVTLYQEKKRYRKPNEISTTKLLASTLCRNIDDGDILQYKPYKQWFKILFSDGEIFKAYYEQIFVNLSLTKLHNYAHI